ncbi:hypothetical protein [Synechococcus sp. RSCCF101]|uniref:hypothetical protein n=1 Tax=Synechococcus sp. RSCCF101 TaxID=2511069 RepID=UPI001786F3E8|nr:hypothetical protein [Synechococcus sp. RSCCF101]
MVSVQCLSWEANGQLDDSDYRSVVLRLMQWDPQANLDLLRITGAELLTAAD